MNGEDHRCSDANFSRASEEAEYLFVARSATLAVSATRSEVKQTCCPAGLPVVPDPFTGKIRRGLWDYLVGTQ